MAEKEKKQLVRLTFDVTSEFHSRLDRLVERAKADSKKDVVRDALQTYDFLLGEHLKGRKVLLEDAEGAVREVLLFPQIPREEPSVTS